MLVKEGTGGEYEKELIRSRRNAEKVQRKE